MTAGKIECPLCDLSQPLAASSSDPDRDRTAVRCRRCGDFSIPSQIPENWDIGRVPQFLLEKRVRRSDQSRGRELLRKYLSIYSRECQETGRRAEFPVPFDLSEMELLAEAYAHTSVPDRADRLLRFLARRTDHPGKPVGVNAYYDYPVAHAIEPEEFDYYLEYLAHAGWIERPAGLDAKISGQDPEIAYDRETVVTVDGWKRIASVGGGRVAFVAMSFAAELEAAFVDGLTPAISDAGYQPLRVDKIEHNEKICDRIVSEIRRARFLIADVTNQRPGVYFEAGFAMGLGMPVIWCCRKDDLANVHFDTRQYNHIVWETPSDLCTKLRDRILATLAA